MTGGLSEVRSDTSSSKRSTNRRFLKEVHSEFKQRKVTKRDGERLKNSYHVELSSVGDISRVNMSHRALNEA